MEDSREQVYRLAVRRGERRQYVDPAERLHPVAVRAGEDVLGDERIRRYRGLPRRPERDPLPVENSNILVRLS